MNYQGTIPQMPFNPQQNYMNRLDLLQNQQKQSIQPQNNVNWVNVNDDSEVRNTTVQPNVKVWFMNTNKPVFYLKEANEMGICTTKAFEFKEIPFKTDENISTEQFITKEQFSGLEAKIEALTAILSSKEVKDESINAKSSKSK